MRDIELPPFAPMLIESTRAIGYSLEAAISDIIDNSISANATTVRVYYLPYSEPYIAILDNGWGMTGEELTEAMRYGSTDPTTVRSSQDMGRYGLELKTASLSQCRCLTVASIKNRELSARQWNLDYVKKTGRWSLKVLEEEDLRKIPLIEELQKYPNGTLVVWQELDKVFSGEVDIEQAMTDKMDSVYKHISLVFHRFLKGGDAEHKVSIFMNDEPVIGFDPFFMSKSRQAMDEERIEIPQYNSVVTVKPFHIFRKGRFLSCYG